ncbi:MFS transporter [Lichenihabitans psoromatis]|uniref:MFS transporter n=1 Tax=Lichenihabitans psoromatis TaxID=2528642 RepID=UPI0010356E84|nr:MFS transporter [Lichenihabitans psoromatis]
MQTSPSFVPQRSTLVALLVAGAFFMENLDGTVIATALPQMAKSFGTTPGSLAIGMTAYLLTVAVFIPASGWVADRYGARPVFASAVALFTIASILCGLSIDTLTFTLARILQGAAGALMTPVGRLVVLRGTAKQDLMRAIATLTWPALTAPVLGPPLGGFITTVASWRWIFFINVPIGIMGLGLALRLIEAGRDEARRPFDALGFVLNGSCLASLLYALERFGQTGGDWRIASLFLIASLTLGTLALRRARTHPHPLVSLEAFRVPSFRVTMDGGLIARITISTMPFLLPLLFQVGLGRDAFTSGLLVLWYGAANLAIKPLTTPILRRFGFRTVLLANTVISASSIAACAMIDRSIPIAVIVLVLMVAGASRSMQFTALNTLAFAELEPGQTGPANTLFNMAFQLALGMGVAFGAIVLRIAEALPAGQGADPSGPFRLCFAIIGLVALTALPAFARLRRDAGQAVSQHRAAATR